jgi:hypothetical protein
MRVGFGFGFTALVDCIIHLVILLNHTLKGNNYQSYEVDYDIFIRDDLIVKPEEYLYDGSSVFRDLLSNMSKKELKRIRKSLSKRLKRQSRQLQKNRIRDQKEQKKAEKKKAHRLRLISSSINAIVDKINNLCVPNGVFNSILEYDTDLKCYVFPERLPYSSEMLRSVTFVWKQYQTHMKNLYTLLDLSNGTSAFLTSNIDVNRNIYDIAESPTMLNDKGFKSFLQKKMRFIISLIATYIHGQYYVNDYYHDNDYDNDYGNGGYGGYDSDDGNNSYFYDFDSYSYYNDIDDEYQYDQYEGKIFVNGEWISANVEYKMFSSKLKKKIDSLILFHMQTLVNNIHKYELYSIHRNIYNKMSHFTNIYDSFVKYLVQCSNAAIILHYTDGINCEEPFINNGFLTQICSSSLKCNNICRMCACTCTGCQNKKTNGHKYKLYEDQYPDYKTALNMLCRRWHYHETH